MKLLLRQECAAHSVYGSLGHGEWMRLRLESDFAESLLVLCDVLIENIEKRLGLLRADVDPLSILDRHLVGALLMNESEGEEKIPHAHANLHTVGVVLTVVLRLLNLDSGLRMTGMHSVFQGKAMAQVLAKAA